MDKIKIAATLIKGKDLKPDGLFSTVGPEYWDGMYLLNKSIGEKVYIYTGYPLSMNNLQDDIYKITVEAINGR